MKSISNFRIAKDNLKESFCYDCSKMCVEDELMPSYYDGGLPGSFECLLGCENSEDPNCDYYDSYLDQLEILKQQYNIKNEDDVD